MPGERAAVEFPSSRDLASMRADSARARPCCPVRLGVRRDSAQERAAGAVRHAALGRHGHRARRRSPAGGHRSGPDRGCSVHGAGRHGLDHRPADAAAIRDGARPRHRSVALPDGRQQSAGPSAPGPGRRGHVDRLRLARYDASARSRRESLGTRGFLHHRHRRAAPDGRAASRLPDRRRCAAIRGLLHPYRPARGARSRRPFPGRVGAAPGYGLDGLALRRYARCHFRPHAAARCRGRPGTARLAVHFGKASRALRAGLPSWAHHAGHHRAAGETPCCGMPRASIACIAPDWPQRKRCAKARNDTARSSRHNRTRSAGFCRTRRSPSSTGRMPSSTVESRKS